MTTSERDAIGAGICCQLTRADVQSNHGTEFKSITQRITCRVIMRP